MQLTIQTSGTPDEVRTVVANEIRAARAGDSEAWPALRAIRDGLALAIDQSGPNDQLGLTVSVLFVRARRLDGAPMTRDAEGRVLGDPVSIGDPSLVPSPAAPPGVASMGLGAQPVERRAKRNDS